MIIERYLFREVAVTLIGVALLLVLIILSGTLVRVLAEAADGNYPQQLVFTLFVLKSVPNLAVVLPLAMMLAVLLALGRLYRDSEMVVLAACGVRPNHIVRPVAVLGLVVALAVLALTVWVVPYTQEQSQRVLDRAAAKSEIEGIAAGRFNSAGNQLVYVEEVSQDRRTLRNIFAYTRDEQGRFAVVSARSAVQQIDQANGDRFLVLHDGYRYEGRPGEPNFRIVHFEQHGLRIGERAIEPSRRALYSRPTDSLLGSSDPDEVAEFHWRLAAPIATFLLSLLAVPLARTNPRQGRYGRLFAGIMAYIIYNNMLTVARAWVAKDMVPGWLGLWWVHLLALAVVILLLWRNTQMTRPLWRWKFA